MSRAELNTKSLRHLVPILAGTIAVWLCGCSLTRSPAAEQPTGMRVEEPARKPAGQPAGMGAAADWVHFLGPNYDGIAPLDKFDPKGLTEVWSRELGPGCSSVTVAEGRLFTMGNRADRDIVYCLDPKTGDEKWTFGYDCELMPKLYEGGPNSTPTIADGRIYTLSRKGQVYCLDAESGEKIWEASYGQWSPKGGWWGFSDSPVVWGDKVFVNLTDKGMALARATGTVVWSGERAVPAYATILPLPEGNPVVDRAALVVQTCRTLNVLAPATGESMLGGAPEWAQRKSNNNAVSPKVYGSGLLVMHAATGLSKISRAGGEWTEEWLCPEFAYGGGDWFTFNRQVIHGKYLYAIAGRGKGARCRLECVNLDTGAIEWTRPEAFGNLILAADKLMIVTEMGEIAWGALDGNAYNETFRQKLLDGGVGAGTDGPYWSHPVLHDGHLYVRSNKGKLTCFRLE